MDLTRIVKWIVAIVVIVFAIKVIGPYLSKEVTRARAGGERKPSSSSFSGSSSGSCVRAAERASETWGGGLAQFVNPPYDISSWSTFRMGVESAIGAAESQCGCSEESCDKAKSAMRELRGLVSEMDGAITGGSSPPSDIVRRQESIDNQLSAASDLVRSGK